MSLRLHLLRYLELKAPCSALECGARCRCSCLKSLKYLSVVWSWVQRLAHKNTMQLFIYFFDSANQALHAGTCKVCNDWQVSAKKKKYHKLKKKQTIKLSESQVFWLTLKEWRRRDQKLCTGDSFITSLGWRAQNSTPAHITLPLKQITAILFRQRGLSEGLKSCRSWRKSCQILFTAMHQQWETLSW